MLVSCPAHSLHKNEGILDAQGPQNAKGDALHATQYHCDPGR